MSLKLVKQNPRKPGCGPACVAMLANVERREAEAQFATGDDERTFWPELRKALGIFNVRTKRPRWAGRLSEAHHRVDALEIELANRLRGNAILKVNENAEGNWHWIAWCNDQQCILDPWDRNTHRRNRRYKVQSFVEVLP